jgi:hypothetical protein
VTRGPIRFASWVGILFETKTPDRDKPLVFGSSGFQHRSNKLMFDRVTNSLWNQFTGKPVSGSLAQSLIALKIRPVFITSWVDWKKRHPHTDVLSLETDHQRNYSSGFVYRDYFSSPDLMFPVLVKNEERVKRKDYVFGIRDVGAAKAWPLSGFTGGRVINDAVGHRKIVLIGDQTTRSVRAYIRKDHQFVAADRARQIKGPGGLWTITEPALIGPKVRNSLGCPDISATGLSGMDILASIVRFTRLRLGVNRSQTLGL